jgi:hypothetical protein
MINPEDQIPPDDTFDDDAEDQQSQQDIHSNGFDDDDLEPIDEDADPADLQQAYDAAEPSYTLNLDDDDTDTDDDE